MFIFPVTHPTTQEAHVNQMMTRSMTRGTHDVQRITPRRILRQQVEVEDVDSDNKDEGEQRESDTAPKDNVGGNQEEQVSGAEAPPIWAVVTGCEPNQIATKTTTRISCTPTQTNLMSFT